MKIIAKLIDYFKTKQQLRAGNKLLKEWGFEIEEEIKRKQSIIPTFRFVQLKNPKSKNYIRIDTLEGKIVGRRKKPYKCKLVK